MLSGVPADGTITAEMAFMFGERSRPDSTIDYPIGGAATVVGALVRGLEKHGGKLLLKSHVDQVRVSTGVEWSLLTPTPALWGGGLDTAHHLAAVLLDGPALLTLFPQRTSRDKLTQRVWVWGARRCWWRVGAPWGCS